MSYRVVTDRTGAAWQVWTVRPTRHGASSAFTVAPEYTTGWLAFERVDDGAAPAPPEKRRLAPVPSGWDQSSDADVLRLLASATPVAARLRSV